MPSAYRVQMLLGVLGGVALAFGADLPIIHIPIIGAISYLRHPADFTSCAIGSVVILIAALVSIIGALLGRFRLLWVTGAAAIAHVTATIFTIYHTTAEILAKTNQPELVDPTLMWAGAALQRARLGWGVGLIAGGSLLVFAAAALEFGGTSPQRDGAIAKSASVYPDEGKG
jgi:hypothetical protein